MPFVLIDAEQRPGAAAVRPEGSPHEQLARRGADDASTAVELSVDERKSRRERRATRQRRASERLVARMDARRRDRAAERERLFELAAEPVPVGSGIVEHGTGPYSYVKGCTVDGSLRVLHFESRDDATCAMFIGVTADEIAERGLDPRPS